MKYDRFHSSARKSYVCLKHWYTNKNYLLVSFTNKNNNKTHHSQLQLGRPSLDVNQHEVFAKRMASVKQLPNFLHNFSITNYLYFQHYCFIIPLG